MAAMNFDPVFIQWIVILHKGAKTRLLLSDLITDTIAVDFSIRQGDPVAMILYVIYGEPLFLKIQHLLSGFCLRAPLLSHPQTCVDAVSEKEENYVDDLECILTNDEEFLIVDSVVKKF